MILACDPGITGALAFISGDGHLVEVVDMPTDEIRGKRRISAGMVANIMRRRPVSLVVIEGVGAIFGGAASSSFTFGYGAGLLEGVAAGLGIPIEVIPAATWKRRAGVPADKGAARQMAQRTWPGAAQQFSRVRDDGRADSSLLGRWAALRSA